MPGAAPTADAGGTGSIVWLASYPKSGNTWLRAFLTSYLNPDPEPLSINALIGGALAYQRALFDGCVGRASSDMTPDEILDARPRFHRRLARDLPRPTFVKVHDACIRTPRGAALFPRAATAGAVYLVRNPLDVAVALANHQGTSVDAAIADMNRAATLAPQTGGLSRQLPQPMLTWSAHVTSWRECAAFPVHVVRYEDLLADPAAEFGGIARFCGLEWDRARLARAVDETAFHRLRDQERHCGFDEKPLAAASFFRAGTAGGWRTALGAGQVRRLVETHEPVMDRFGYLREAEAYLDDCRRRGHRHDDRRTP